MAKDEIERYVFYFFMKDKRLRQKHELIKEEEVKNRRKGERVYFLYFILKKTYNDMLSNGIMSIDLMF